MPNNDLIARVHASANPEEAAAVALNGILDTLAAKMQHAPAGVLPEIESYRAMVPALARAITTDPGDPVVLETVASAPVKDPDLPKEPEPFMAPAPTKNASAPASAG